MLFSQYIDNLAQQSKLFFTLSDTQSALNKSMGAIRSSIVHLVAKKRIVKIVNGFYIIVPQEYKAYGCLPPEKFLPDLMIYLGYNYYIGSLTAAMYHGASHQSPQIYHAIINKKRPTILTCGKFEVHFLIKKDFSSTYTQNRLLKETILKISIPESTAFDLLLYPKASGGINHIATVLDELKDSMDLATFKKVTESQPKLSCKQRLGYILEFIGAIDLASIIYENLLAYPRIPYIALSPRNKVDSSTKKNLKWRILENLEIESDI